MSTEKVKLRPCPWGGAPVESEKPMSEVEQSPSRTVPDTGKLREWANAHDVEAVEREAAASTVKQINVRAGMLSLAGRHRAEAAYLRAEANRIELGADETQVEYERFNRIEAEKSWKAAREDCEIALARAEKYAVALKFIADEATGQNKAHAIARDALDLP